MADHPRGTDNLMTSLKVIGRVRQHEKVSTTAESFASTRTKGTGRLDKVVEGESRENNLEA